MKKTDSPTFFQELRSVLAHQSGSRGKVAVEPEVWRDFCTDSAPTDSTPKVNFENVASVPEASQSPENTREIPRPVVEVAPAPAVEMVSEIPPVIEPAPTANAAESPLPEPATPPVLPQPLQLEHCSWREVWTAASGCERCKLCHTRNHMVFGEGNSDADLMFIGEGPGAEEDASGRPFVGEAGQLLTKMIAAMQFSREEVYIANVVKCRPPGNRTPVDAEAAACLPYLRRQITLVQPKVIVLLGAVPLRFLLQREGIGRNRGHWTEYEGIPVMPTYHPAFLLRKPEAKRDVWMDLQQVMKRFGKMPAARR